MKINVTGDVQVYGMVENACIDAGGNIDIKFGAVGHTSGSGSEERIQINCKGNLSASQLENVYVNVQGDVFIKSRISNCDVKAGHQVIVGNPLQDKSGIVGGHITARTLIRTEVLGSSAGAVSSVTIACSNEILERFDYLKKEITENEQLLGKVLELSVALAKKQTKEANQLLDKVKQDTKIIKAKMDDLISQKYEIEATLEHSKSGKIIVQKEAYHGVTVKIMDKEQKIKARYSQGTFLIFEGTMAFSAVIS